jgi:hypothetical protein
LIGEAGPRLELAVVAPTHEDYEFLAMVEVSVRAHVPAAVASPVVLYDDTDNKQQQQHQRTSTEHLSMQHAVRDSSHEPGTVRVF